MLRKRNVAITISGVLAALSMVIMLLSAVLSIASIALCALSGMLLAIVVIEFGNRYALTSYFVTTMLCAMLVPDKETVVLYAFFFGLYPILKSFFERIRSKLLLWALKLTFFNVMMLAYYYLAVIVLLVPADSFLFFGGTTPLLLLLLGNVVFVLYDIAFSRLIALYIFRLQKDFRRRLGL